MVERNEDDALSPTPAFPEFDWRPITSNDDPHRESGAAERRRTALEYDALPYPSLLVAYSQPAQLAAQALLHGFEPASAATARALEFGCASGGNIISLAVRFPDASFLGVDISHRQIDDGRRRVAALSLTNIVLRQADLADANFEPNAFDFMLCHGVFSWVPRVVQDAILRICGESLAPRGMAAISFNVLPGWHLRSVARDICLMHAGSDGTPAERAERARKDLIETAQALQDQSPYALSLRDEARRIATQPLSYIQGEFLAASNAPCHFNEFAGRTEAVGLSYLREGELASSLPEYFVPAAAKQIRAMAGSDPIAVQRYADMISGAPFGVQS